MTERSRTPGDEFPAVYAELRRLAAARLAGEAPGQTLDATALVHEVYLRLTDSPAFANRGHFFAAAAEAADRNAYLDEACAGDAALRQRVEALLRAQDGPSDIGGTPGRAGSVGSDTITVRRR